MQEGNEATRQQGNQNRDREGAGRELQITNYKKWALR
jgi:hypothetical protein